MSQLPVDSVDSAQGGRDENDPIHSENSNGGGKATTGTDLLETGKASGASTSAQTETEHRESSHHEVPSLPPPSLLPSILPLLTKEIRDEYSKHVELSKETAAKTKKNYIPKNPLWGVPTLLCSLLVFFAIGVVAYAVTFQHNPSFQHDLVEPPYQTSSPTPVP
jgi:hypothetical protein